jgi:hypothetical protein
LDDLQTQLTTETTFDETPAIHGLLVALGFLVAIACLAGSLHINRYILKPFNQRTLLAKLAPFSTKVAH